MEGQTISTGPAPEIEIDQVSGNLQIKGWEESQVAIKADPDELDLESQEEVVRLSCRGDCIVRLPHGSSIRVGSVHGDAQFKLLEDELDIQTAHGNLNLRNVATVHFEAVNGDVTARRIAGDLQAGRVKGNFTARDVQGNCIVENVDGDLDLRDVEGEIRATTRGSARLRLGSMTASSYQVAASGDVNCRIPEGASARLHLASDGESIHVKLPDQSRTIHQGEVELTIGDGEASFDIHAGGSILLSSEPAGWGDVEDLEGSFEDFGRFSDEFSQQISQQVEAQVEAMTRRLNEQMMHLSTAIGKAGLSQEQTEQILQQARETSERATARAQEKMRRAQERLERKLEAARRRNELKAQAAERRAQGRGKGSWNFEWRSPPPPAAKEPVSDEERLMILRMLEQKKITPEEAEQLLSALEGNE